MFCKRSSVLKSLFSVLGAFVVVVGLFLATARESAADFGTQADFWNEMCFVEAPNTNVLEKIDDAIAVLMRIEAVALDLIKISDYNFSLPELTNCVPNIGIGLPNIPGFDAFLNCFNLFQPPDFNALIANMQSCIDGTLQQYSQLAIQVNSNVNFENLFSCITPNYTIPTITLGDGLLEILSILRQAIDILGQMKASLGRFRFTADFIAHICGTQIRASSQSFEASGASYGANSNQAGQNLNLNFQYNPGQIGPSASAASLGGPSVAAAAEVLSVTAFVTGSGTLKGKKKSVKKSFKLKRGAGNTFSGKINLVKLGCPGSYKIAYMVEASNGAATFPGAPVKLTSCR